MKFTLCIYREMVSNNPVIIQYLSHLGVLIVKSISVLIKVLLATLNFRPQSTF